MIAAFDVQFRRPWGIYQGRLNRETLGDRSGRARPIGQDLTVELNGAQVPTFFTFIRNTDPGSNAGIPGISLPAGITPARLPVGVELDGPAGSDLRLLAIAAAIEAVLPPPPVPPLS